MRGAGAVFKYAETRRLEQGPKVDGLFLLLFQDSIDGSEQTTLGGAGYRLAGFQAVQELRRYAAARARLFGGRLFAALCLLRCPAESTNATVFWAHPLDGFRGDREAAGIYVVGLKKLGEFGGHG